jgi:hypothetical protein
MIKNLPTFQDFEDVSKQCLTQAFNLLYKVYENYNEYNDDAIREEVTLEQIWKHNSGTIRTSLIILHQGIETYMKAAICKTTPLLLIEKTRTDWPSLPSRADKEFDSLYTISGEALLTTFCAVPIDITITEEFIQFIESVRQKRNEAIHGANKISISAKELIDNILKAYTFCFGKDAWFLESGNYNFKNPLFGYFDWGFEYASSYLYLDFALDMLGKKILNKYLKTDITGRAYFCPECKRTIDGDYGYLESKWAFLKPNKPDSTNLHCVNCGIEFNVIRKDCFKSDCKGNVIHDYGGEITCLTCFEYQDGE